MPRAFALRSIRIAFAALACTLAVQASAASLLDEVLATLGAEQAVRARFTQERTNPALAAPQLSHGRLLFVIGKGMLWQVEEPYAETLAFTPRQNARIDADGKLHPMRAQRGMAEVTRMLQALLAGDARDVERQFVIEASGTNDAWTLHFTPRQERVARVLGSIELAGGRFLERIRIAMRDGDATLITMEGTRAAAELEPFERRALGVR